MSTPLLGVSFNHNIFRVSYRGLHAWCTGCAGDPEGTVYVSLIGRVTAVTGIWAAFQQRAPLDTGVHLPIYKLPNMEGAKYHTIRVRLPESDWLHLVLLHSQATMNNLPDQDFYILSATKGPPLEAFWVQWNNALPLPALPEWARRLWEAGISEKLITRCLSKGTICWKVDANLRYWQEIVQRIVKAYPPQAEIGAKEVTQ